MAPWWHDEGEAAEAEAAAYHAWMEAEWRRHVEDDQERAWFVWATGQALADRKRQTWQAFMLAGLRRAVAPRTTGVR